jgi:VIT1/CCC1 family predicted Fe2+/Mn2+ transporter
MSNQPPPVPPPIPPRPVEYHTPQTSNQQSYTGYDRVADTVGMVPNVRLKDNLYQLIAGIIGAMIGAVTAYVLALNGISFAPAVYMLIPGAIAGFVVAAMLWGIGLGIVGIVRGVKNK